MITLKLKYFLVGMLCMLLCACNKPPSDYELADGQTGFFSQWHDHWVIINYWATWCEPCHKEIPEFNAFSKTHGDVVVLGVNFDQPQGEALKKDIAQMNVEFPVLVHDPATALHFNSPSVLPVTVILNPQGKVQTMLLGPQTQITLAKAIEAK